MCQIGKIQEDTADTQVVRRFAKIMKKKNPLGISCHARGSIGNGTLSESIVPSVTGFYGQKATILSTLNRHCVRGVAMEALERQDRMSAQGVIEIGVEEVEEENSKDDFNFRHEIMKGSQLTLLSTLETPHCGTPTHGANPAWRWSPSTSLTGRSVAIRSLRRISDGQHGNGHNPWPLHDKIALHLIRHACSARLRSNLGSSLDRAFAS